MTPQTRLSLNTNLDGMDERLLFPLIDEWQSAGWLFMNAFKRDDPLNIGWRAKERIDAYGGMVCVRIYGAWERRFWERSIDADEAHARATISDDVYWHLGNEPDGGEENTKASCAWLEARFARAIADKRHLVAASPAPSSIESGQLEAGWWDRLLIAWAKYADVLDAHGNPYIMLGQHDRWTGHASANTAGRDPHCMMDPAQMARALWPKQAAVAADPKRNHHAYRALWLYDRLETLYQMGKVKRPARQPEMWLTETGPEDMPDFERELPDVYRFLTSIAGGKLYGMPTVEKLHRFWFGNTPLAVSQCEEFDGYLGNLPHRVRVVSIFQLTFHDAFPEYWSRRYSPHVYPEFLKLWPDYGAMPTSAPPIVVTPPAPVPAPPPVVIPPPETTTPIVPNIIYRFGTADEIRAIADDLEAAAGHLQRAVVLMRTIAAREPLKETV